MITVGCQSKQATFEKTFMISQRSYAHPLSVRTIAITALLPTKGVTRSYVYGKASVLSGYKTRTCHPHPVPFKGKLNQGGGYLINVIINPKPHLNELNYRYFP